MIPIRVKKLTEDNFQRYGVFQNLLDQEQMAKKSIRSSDFFVDLVPLDFGGMTLPTISVCHVIKQEKMLVDFLEVHQHTCEGLLPLDSDVVIFVGIPKLPELSAENLEAFYVPKGTFVKLNPLIVHGKQYVIGEEEAHIVCMLPGRTFQNDRIARRLQGDEVAELIAGEWG